MGMSYGSYKRKIFMSNRKGCFYAVEKQSLDIVGLQAMYATTNIPELIDGIIKPKTNIATTKYGVIVVKGVGGNNMLNENSDEFTFHENGSHIELQFNQPYHIGSLRMLLGNHMNHLNKYSFRIETSMYENKHLEMAVDKQNETLSGWQDFEFKPRKAIFIKITGVGGGVSIANEHYKFSINKNVGEFTFFVLFSIEF